MKRLLLPAAAMAAAFATLAQPAIHGPVAFLRPGRADHGDRFGIGISIEGGWMAVGAPAPGGGGLPSREGFVAMYRRTAGGWLQDAIVESPPSDSEDYFGWFVAVSQGRVAISSRLLDLHGMNTGGVRVYKRAEGSWQLEALLTADESGRNSLAEFGRGMALSGDWLAAGCPRDDDRGFNSGSVYLFHRTEAGWVQTAKLTSPTPSAGAEYGQAVALTGDYLAVGQGIPPANDQPSVALYKRGADDSWSFDGLVAVPLEGLSLQAEPALALHGDRLLARSRADHGGQGSAHLFQRGAAGWTLGRSFRMPDGWAETDLPEPGLGSSLALGDGRVAVAARYADAGAPNAGLVMVSLESDQWDSTTLAQPLPTPVANATFGWGVALGGPWLAVGANDLPNAAAPRVGGVWLYWIGETPRLEARRLESGAVELSWPSSAADWRLESREGPQEARWAPVEAGPLEIGGRFAMAVDPGLPSHFYRLALHGAPAE